MGKPQPAGYTLRDLEGKSESLKDLAQSHHHPNPPSQRRKGLHLTTTKERNLQRLKTASLQHQKIASPLNPEDELQQQLHQEAEETEQLSQARTLADSIKAELEQQFAIQFAERLEEQGILHHFPDVEAELEHSSDRKGK